MAPFLHFRGLKYRNGGTKYKAGGGNSMSFSRMFDLLREKEQGKVVFVKCGHFYIAIEEDAVLLNDLLGLKCTCFRENTCKVGVPVNSIEKYINKLQELRYGYVVYDYDKTNIELRKISEGKGKEKFFY